MRSNRVLGRVKWFNNKLGYGFIKYMSQMTGEDDDIFVHWSHLSIPEGGFRTLYEGEYVEFEIIPCEGDEKKTQAHKVSGPMGGPLLATTNKTMLSIARGTFLSSNANNTIFKVQQIPMKNEENIQRICADL